MSNEPKNNSFKIEAKRKMRRKKLTKFFVWIMLLAIIASVFIGAGFAIFNLIGQ